MFTSSLILITVILFLAFLVDSYIFLFSIQLSLNISSEIVIYIAWIESELLELKKKKKLKQAFIKIIKMMSGEGFSGQT